MARRLLDLGADVACKDRSGATPLHWAAYRGHRAIVEELLRREANACAVDDRGWTPRDLAALADPPDLDLLAILDLSER